MFRTFYYNLNMLYYKILGLEWNNIIVFIKIIYNINVSWFKIKKKFIHTNYLNNLSRTDNFKPVNKLSLRWLHGKHHKFIALKSYDVCFVVLYISVRANFRHMFFLGSAFYKYTDTKPSCIILTLTTLLHTYHHYMGHKLKTTIASGWASKGHIRLLSKAFPPT